MSVEHVRDRQLRIDRPRIDREAGRLCGEPAFHPGETQLMTRQVQEIRRILPIVDRKRRIEPDMLGVLAQEPCANAMKCASPGERVGHSAGVGAQHLGTNPLHATRHLGSGPARESHEQNAARIGALDDQVGDAMGQSVGLARPGAGDDEERSSRKRSHGRAAGDVNTVFDGPSLLGVKLVEIGAAHGP